MMAVAVLVALSAIYLTTFVSADCDTLLMRCFTNSWQTCSSFGAVGSLTLADCGRAHQLCIATKFVTESASSQAQSNSSASDVKRYTNNFENSTGCGSDLRRCLEKGDPAKNSAAYGITAGICRRLFEQCRSAEIESAQSLVELGQNTLDAERSASSSEATAAECESQLAACLVITYTKCSELNLACPTAEADCYYRHGLCKTGENESDKSKVELTRSEAEFMRNASLRPPRGCDSPRVRCVLTMLMFHRVLQLHCSVNDGDCLSHSRVCRANPIEIAQSQPESSSSAFRYERNTNSPASPTEIVRSQPESSLGTSGVERNANSPARPTVPEMHSGSGKISSTLQLLQLLAHCKNRSPADSASSLEPAISCGSVLECFFKIFVI